MEAVAKMFIGLLLLAMSLAYLYRPARVLRLNEFFRTVLFDDAYVLHYRRRWGVPLFVAAVLFLYSGVSNLKIRPSDPATAAYTEMDEAYRAFYTRRYDDARRLCRAILRAHPGDPHANFLLRQTTKALERAAAPPAPAPTAKAGRHRR